MNFTSCYVFFSKQKQMYLILRNYVGKQFVGKYMCNICLDTSNTLECASKQPAWA